MAMSPAEQILIDLGVTEPSDIDLEAIAWHLDARVEFRPLTGCEAQIIGIGDRAEIIVNNSSASARQRFSIGHELAHWHYHRGQAIDCRTNGDGGPSSASSPQERMADAFAADLLLPRYLVEPRVSGMKVLDVNGVGEIASEFATSFTATAIRLVRFGVVPAIIVCHGVEGRKWFARSPEVAEGWYIKDELDPDSSAFEVVYGKLRQGKPRQIKASAWFNGGMSERYQIREEALRINDDQTLVLLNLPDLAIGHL